MLLAANFLGIATPFATANVTHEADMSDTPHAPHHNVHKSR